MRAKSARRRLEPRSQKGGCGRKKEVEGDDNGKQREERKEEIDEGRRKPMEMGIKRWKKGDDKKGGLMTAEQAG